MASSYVVSNIMLTSYIHYITEKIKLKLIFTFFIQTTVTIEFTEYYTPTNALIVYISLKLLTLKYLNCSYMFR